MGWNFKWWKRNIRKCVICGEEFESNYPNQITCSKECSMANKKAQKKQWQKDHYRELYERYKKPKHEIVEESDDNEKTCVVCGKKFVTKDSRVVCCSEECKAARRHEQKMAWQHKAYVALKEQNKVESADENNKEKERIVGATVKCIICGKDFTPKTINHKVCSDECRKKYARIVTDRWNAAHAEERKKRQREYYLKRRGNIPVVDKHRETAEVLRNLIASGVDDGVVAKYLQTVYGDK